MSLRTETVAAVFFGILLFPSLYVNATMNALYDGYFVGVEAFKAPFYYAYYVFAIILLLLFFISSYKRLRYKCGYPVAKKIAISVLLVSAIVGLLGQLPCVHKLTDPNTLGAVVSASFFCPSYSNRSYVGLSLTVFLGVALFLVSNQRRNVSP